MYQALCSTVPNSPFTPLDPPASERTRRRLPETRGLTRISQQARPPAPADGAPAQADADRSTAAMGGGGRSRTLRSTRSWTSRLLSPEPGPDRGRQGWRGQDHHGRGPGPSGRPGRAFGAGGRARGAPRGGHRLRAASGPLDYAGSVLKAAGATADRGRRRGRRPRPSRRARCGPGPSPPTTPCSSTWPTTGCGGSPSGCMSSGIVDLVAGAIPGIRDVLVLGKVKQIERSGHRRPDPGRRAGHRAHHDLPLLGRRPARRRPGRADPRPGRRRGRAAVRSGPVPGGPGHPARGDAGQRGHRGRLPARGQGGHRPRPGDRQRLLPAAGRAGRAGRPRRPRRPGSTLDPELVAALDQARRFRLTRQELQEEQLERLAHELPLPQLRVPFLFTAAIGPPELDALSRRPGRRGRGPPRPGRGAVMTDRRTAARPSVVARRASDRHLLRLGGRGQDHHGGRLRPPGGPAGSAAPAW